jgi:hypothetical protein
MNYYDKKVAYKDALSFLKAKSKLKAQATKPRSKTSITGIGKNSNVQSRLTKKAVEPGTNGETIIISGDDDESTKHYNCSKMFIDALGVGELFEDPHVHCSRMTKDTSRS